MRRRRALAKFFRTPKGLLTIVLGMLTVTGGAWHRPSARRAESDRGRFSRRRP